MKTTHTKGEWKVVNPDTLLQSNYLIETDEVQIAKTRDTGASFKPKSEALANAKLIAAAPRGIETAIKTYIDLLQITDHVWRGTHQETYCRLRDFISEATGNTSREVQEHYEQIALKATN